mmetsp:Transcript_35056/g.56600  ORF Transcript_35056/g.56600 Transcript_35056/m.56600 type:complete len:95 (-) Transcript_35056:114-398(-)
MDLMKGRGTHSNDRRFTDAAQLVGLQGSIPFPSQPRCTTIPRTVRSLDIPITAHLKTSSPRYGMSFVITAVAVRIGEREVESKEESLGGRNNLI